MGAEHLLAKMTAKGLTIGFAGFGGVALVSMNDVAAALAGLPNHCYWLARAKYCGDMKCSDQVWQYMQNEIQKIEKLSTDQSRSLALTSLYPIIVGVKCKICFGTGMYRYKHCKTCGGTGHGVILDYQKASMMQVSKATFCRRFKKIAEKWESKAWIWDSIAIEHLYKQFREDAA